jgi:hypothetical protein
MCDFCFDKDPVEHAALGEITPAIMRRMREIEASIPGEAVPEAAWAVFLGTASGALSWGQYERMAACRTEALAARGPTIPGSNIKEALFGRAGGKANGSRTQGQSRTRPRCW